MLEAFYSTPEEEIRKLQEDFYAISLPNDHVGLIKTVLKDELKFNKNNPILERLGRKLVHETSPAQDKERTSIRLSLSEVNFINSVLKPTIDYELGREIFQELNLEFQEKSGVVVPEYQEYIRKSVAKSIP